MSYVPRHQAQLGKGIPVPGRTRGSRDCGPRTVSMGIDFVTKGHKRPGMAEVRRRMGRPGPQQTNILNSKRCVESISIRGHKPLRYYIKDHVESVHAAVKAGRFVQCCLDYGEFNRLMHHRTGDPVFTGGHSVGVVGHRVRNGVTQWLLFDPLDDQRRHGIPAGPRWVPAWKVSKAMEKFTGLRGRCFAGVFGGAEKR